MQQELDALQATTDGLPISILGVNVAGAESGNALNCAGRTLPWLQDSPAVDAWASWAVTWRDVVILDSENRKVGLYNLTTQSLADSTNYATLKNMLLQAAAAP